MLSKWPELLEGREEGEEDGAEEGGKEGAEEGVSIFELLILVTK
jgi:hypothetical protein